MHLHSLRVYGQSDASDCMHPGRILKKKKEPNVSELMQLLREQRELFTQTQKSPFVQSNAKLSRFRLK